MGKEEKGVTPVHGRNDVVKYFVNLEEHQGEKFDISTTGWGDFIMMKKEVFERFLKFSESMDKDTLAYLSPHLCRFICLNLDRFCDGNMKGINEKFVTVEAGLLEEYRNWCTAKKAELLV